MPATIKDIAKVTGLGYATISAYLNCVPVRPKNKVLIEDAIKKLGYVRNEYARGLKMQKSMTIGVLIPELSNIFSTTIISEMEDVLRSKGYGIIVCDCRSNKEIEKTSLNFLLSKMVDGIIVMPISLDGELFKDVENKPIVVIDRMTTCEKASHIVINNVQISENAVNKLIQKGHKNIAIITGNEEVYTSAKRKLGYKNALDSVGYYNENYVYNGGLSVEGAYLAMKKIIREQKDVTAIFVTNYEMTVGAIIAINEEGKKIPDDYSFIGFDNHELSKVYKPKLTTVNQPLKEIGREAGIMMLAKIANEEVKNIVLEASIEGEETIKLI